MITAIPGACYISQGTGCVQKQLHIAYSVPVSGDMGLAPRR